MVSGNSQVTEQIEYQDLLLRQANFRGRVQAVLAEVNLIFTPVLARRPRTTFWPSPVWRSATYVSKCAGKTKYRPSSIYIDRKTRDECHPGRQATRAYDPDRDPRPKQKCDVTYVTSHQVDLGAKRSVIWGVDN